VEPRTRGGRRRPFTPTANRIAEMTDTKMMIT
jgi:hypothetical protein